MEKEYFLDKAYRFKRKMRETKMSQSALARELNTSHANVCNHLRVLEFSKNIRKCMRKNNMTLQKAILLLKNHKNLTEEQMMKIIRYDASVKQSVRKYENLIDYVVMRQKEKDSKNN